MTLFEYIFNHDRFCTLIIADSGKYKTSNKKFKPGSEF